MRHLVKKKGKDDLKGLILDAAKKLFVSEGFSATSIRKIASEIGYSPTTIYLYYKDKSDIVYALHSEGFAILKVLFTSLSKVESPFERLKAIGRTYLQFARDHPDYYQVMFSLKEPMEYLNAKSEKDSWEDGKQVFGVLVSTIDDCKKAGFFRQADSGAVALQAWSLVHGLSSLYLTTRLQKVGEECLSQTDADILLESAFTAYTQLMEQTKTKYK